MSKWDENQYLKFAEERKQPCIDLINKLIDEYNCILDLGCGPGNSTKILRERFPYAEIVGMDIDNNMLERAKKDCPNAKFINGNIPSSLSSLENKFDLIFSNACIHWIDNQNKLITEVYDKLNDNGVFAVQIPLTQESIFYKNLNDLLDTKWSKLKSINNFHNLSVNGYYNELMKKFKKVTIWTTDYYHILDSKEDILEWYKGSGLRPYIQALSETEQKLFLVDIKKMIYEKYQSLEDGKTFLIMPRLFFIANK